MSDIRDLMITEPLICTPLTSIDNIIKIMEDNNTNEIMVVDTILEKHLVGKIYGNDISAKSIDQSVSPGALNAEQVMRPVTVTMRETATEKECLRLMDLNQIDELAIVDEEGHLCGIYNRQIH